MFLIGKKSTDQVNAKELFEVVFDTNSNRVIDKMEVLCAICLLSSISTEAKIHYFFDIFDFNKKGYLIESEISLMIHTITDVAYKIDSSILHPSETAIQILVTDIMNSVGQKRNDYKYCRKPNILQYSSFSIDIRTFLEMWLGHSSQIFLPENEKVSKKI